MKCTAHTGSGGRSGVNNTYQRVVGVDEPAAEDEQQQDEEEVVDDPGQHHEAELSLHAGRHEHGEAGEQCEVHHQRYAPPDSRCRVGRQAAPVSSVRKLFSRSKFTEQIFIPQTEQNFQLRTQIILLLRVAEQFM